MAYDDIGVLRFFLVITGAVPGDWQEPWKQTAFWVYAYFVDFQYLFFMVTKVSYTIRSTDFKQDHFYDFFESLIIISLVLERMLIRWKTGEILQLFGKMDEFPKPGLHVTNLAKIYRKQAHNVLIVFGILNGLCLLGVILNYMKNYCDPNEVLDDQRMCTSFIIEIDLPSTVLRHPWYNLLFVYNVILVFLIVFLGLISFIMIPMLVIKLSCQFKIVADAFEKRLKVGVYKLRSVESSTNGEEDLVNVIKQHQSILEYEGSYENILKTIYLCIKFSEVSSMMTKTFHIIVLEKLVFLTLPIIVGTYCLSHFPIGSLAFLRITVPLLAIFTKLATFCYFGEELTSHSLMVYRAVYMNQWYRMDKDDKKMLLIVATRAIRPARLEVWSHFVPVSFETFVNVCQFCYSVYSVLMVVSSKSK